MLYIKRLIKASDRAIHFVNKLNEKDLVDTCRNNHLFVAELDGLKLVSEYMLLESVKSVFSLPSYFGYNWDALHECLCDLSWLPADGYVLIIKNAKIFFQNDFMAAGKFTEIWMVVARLWLKEDKPFHLIYLE